MKLVGILVGVVCAIAFIVVVLLARPASPMSIPPKSICPGARDVWQSKDLGEIYAKYIATRIQPNEPIPDRAILGAAWDVLNCVRNGTDQ